VFDGKLFLDARCSQNLLQKELAHKAGCGVRVVRDAEAGRPISYPKAVSLADVLNIPQPAATGHTPAPASRKIVVVHGMPGIGKTTLTNVLMSDPDLSTAFSFGLWAWLGPKPNLLNSLLQCASALADYHYQRNRQDSEARALRDLPLRVDEMHLKDDAKDNAKDDDAVDYVNKRLNTFLRNKRAFIVLDDVWEKKHFDAMKVGGRYCSILATTRGSGLAHLIGSGADAVRHIGELSHLDAITLLNLLTADRLSSYPNAASQLATGLGCHPMALMLAGKLLADKLDNISELAVRALIQEFRDAKRLLSEIAPKDGTEQLTVNAMIKLSTDALDPETQKRFARLCSLCAPKPATIPVFFMKSAWGCSDEEAESTASVLAERGLLQRRPDGEFWLHALVKAHGEWLLKQS
jgi:hypothetical protein